MLERISTNRNFLIWQNIAGFEQVDYGFIVSSTNVVDKIIT